MKMQAPFLMRVAFMLQQILIVRSDLERLALVHVRDIDVDSPGLLNFLVKGKDYNLMSSSFSTSINTKDKAFVIENVGHINKTVVKPFQTTFFHPKDISQVPGNAFDFEAVSIPDGSPLVGKSDGKVLVVDVTDVNFQKFYDLTTPRIPNLKFFQFGRVVWTDLGGIWQKQHFLVCRSAAGPELSQLVFYERPKVGDELSKPWKEIILREGACDSNLAELHVKQNRENWEIVYATGKTTQSLNFFWPETPKGGLGWWNDPDQIKGRVLDKGREYYDVRVFDVNKDRVPDVLVTVLGNRSNKNGTLEIWEIDPVNFRNVEGYTRHVIGHGFAPKTTGSDARSPGAVKVFYPTKNHTVKPWILLAGGDDGRAYYFTPKSEDPLQWDYEKNEIPLKNSLSVTGVEAQDVDGDGYSEVFVSLHDSDTVKVFTFRPEPTTVAPQTTAVRPTPQRTTTGPRRSTTTSARPTVPHEASTTVKPTAQRTTTLPSRSTTTRGRPTLPHETTATLPHETTTTLPHVTTTTLPHVTTTTLPRRSTTSKSTLPHEATSPLVRVTTTRPTKARDNSA